MQAARVKRLPLRGDKQGRGGVSLGRLADRDAAASAGPAYGKLVRPGPQHPLQDKWRKCKDMVRTKTSPRRES